MQMVFLLFSPAIATILSGRRTLDAYAGAAMSAPFHEPRGRDVNEVGVGSHQRRSEAGPSSHSIR